MGFLYCFIYLTVIGALFFIIGRIMPKRWFNGDKFPYKCFAFEKSLYVKLKIKVWGVLLPDMSKIFPKLMPEKRLTEDYITKYPLMVKETCIAELTHFLLCIAGFECVRVWKGIGGIIVSILYCLGNIPFIMVQRYNRERFIRLYGKIIDKEDSKNDKAGNQLQGISLRQTEYK